MDADLITVNNIFGHWVKDIDIRQYPDDTRILPTNNSEDVCQYSVQQLKYLPQLSLNTIQKKFLYSKTAVYLEEDTDRRSNA